MDDPDPGAWTEETTGRERVRMVIETLDSPATISEIQEAADTSWATVDSEIERLVEDNQVRPVEEDGATKYVQDPAREFIDEIIDHLELHTKEELESLRIDLQEEVETLQDEYEADDASAFRERMADADLTADELREIRNTAETWEALETELRHVRQALNLYDDVHRHTERVTAQLSEQVALSITDDTLSRRA